MERTVNARPRNRGRGATRMLCEGAIMVALAQILSYIKLMELPNAAPSPPPCSPSSSSACAGA